MAIVVGTNTYISVVDADAYQLGNVSGDSWTDLTTDEKERALVSATRMLDRQRWEGTKTDPDQLLQWPRTGATDAYGDEADSAEVPQQIKDAQAELALSLALDPSVVDASGTNKGIKRLKAGSAEIEYFYSSANSRFATVINELIGPFLLGTSSNSNLANAGGFASGTCERSVFRNGEFDLTEPL